MRSAVLLSLLSLCLTGGLARAQEHKAESKDEKQAATHGEKKDGEKKDDKKAVQKSDQKKDVKHEEAKAETHAEPAKPAEPRPSALPPRPPAIHRPTPLARLGARTTPRPASRAATTATSPAAKPAATLMPIVVEVRQEPARVEAVLHVVPSTGLPVAVTPFAGAGPYPVSSPLNALSYAQATPAPPMTSSTPSADEQAEMTVGNFAPAANIPASYPPVAYQAPAPRNILRTPKNALTNEGLVLLAQVGYDEDFILDLMRMKNCRFDTSVEGLAYLATHGLTERVIRAALTAGEPQETPLQARTQ